MIRSCLLLAALGLIALSSLPAPGQTKPAGSASTSGPCSPVVSGNNDSLTINCSIDKTQGNSLEDLIQLVRPAVVEVAVVITDKSQMKPTAESLPQSVKDCFGNTPQCLSAQGSSLIKMAILSPRVMWQARSSD